MFDIRVDGSFLQDIARKIEAQIIPDIEEKIAEDLEDSVKSKTPRVTGNLASRWIVTKSGSDFVIENDEEYARYVIEGTRPYTIRAKNARALAFQMNGRTVFAKSVQHPGIKANPFVDDAIDDTMSRVDSIIHEALKDGGLI